MRLKKSKKDRMHIGIGIGVPVPYGMYGMDTDNVHLPTNQFVVYAVSMLVQ